MDNNSIVSETDKFGYVLGEFFLGIRILLPISGI
jgi:hypothetical protein